MLRTRGAQEIRVSRFRPVFFSRRKIVLELFFDRMCGKR